MKICETITKILEKFEKFINNLEKNWGKYANF